ncbi:MAG: galactose mutarotase [Bacteroidetes bacterium]|nr:galactose mutarotase [Bacteroidota bacterium]
MKATRLQILICVIILFTACNQGVKENGANKKGVTKKEWGTVDDKPVYLFTLTNSKGDYVTISNYGSTVTSFVVPDKNGNKSGIIIGFDSLSTYLKHPPYFGATIGRYGNRIGNAQFKLGDSTYHLAANDGKNSLHGGLKGFDKVVWDAMVADSTSPELSLTYLSKDGEEGYPGNLKVTVTYTFTDSDELKIQYAAETDKPTPVNLTNHSYFNLSGDVNNTILDHTLMIDADAYTPVDSTLIPTGEIKPVKGTPFDFTTAKKIGLDISAVPGGYDHNWVLNNKNGALAKVAVLSDVVSRRSLEVFTTEPGLQFYAGNFLDGSFINRDGKPIQLRTALCLETQHFPDSPNKPGFPSTILQPGQQYSSTTIYKVIVQ